MHPRRHTYCPSHRGKDLGTETGTPSPSSCSGVSAGPWPWCHIKITWRALKPFQRLGPASEIQIGWVCRVAQASAFLNTSPGASSVQPELGAAGQQRPPRWSLEESNPLTFRDAGVQFLPAPAAWLASALPTKPAPPRQAGSTINFNSKLFLFIIFKCSRP